MLVVCVIYASLLPYLTRLVLQRVHGPVHPVQDFSSVVYTEPDRCLFAAALLPLYSFDVIYC